MPEILRYHILQGNITEEAARQLMSSRAYTDSTRGMSGLQKSIYDERKTEESMMNNPMNQLGSFIQFLMKSLGAGGVSTGANPTSPSGAGIKALLASEAVNAPADTAHVAIDEHIDRNSILNNLYNNPDALMDYTGSRGVSAPNPAGLSGLLKSLSDKDLGSLEQNVLPSQPSEPFVPGKFDDFAGVLKDTMPSTAPLQAQGIGSYRELDKSNLSAEENFNLILHASRASG